MQEQVRTHRPAKACNGRGIKGNAIGKRPPQLLGHDGDVFLFPRNITKSQADELHILLLHILVYVLNRVNHCVSPLKIVTLSGGIAAHNRMEQSGLLNGTVFPARTYRSVRIQPSCGTAAKKGRLLCGGSSPPRQQTSLFTEKIILRFRFPVNPFRLFNSTEACKF